MDQLVVPVDGARPSRRALVAVLAAVAVLASVFGLESVARAETTGDFAVSVAPPIQFLAPGGNAEYLVDIAATGGFTGTVALAASQSDGAALPAGLSVTFTPASVTPGTPSRLRVSAAASYTGGSLALRITGTSGSLVRTAGITASADIGLVEQCLVTVRGTVRSAAAGNPPIEGVTVTTAQGPVRTATTGADGRYELTGVPLGQNNAPLVAFPLRASKNPPSLNRIGTFWDATAATDLVCGRVPTVDLQMVEVVPAQLGGLVLEGELGTDGVTVQPKVPPVPVVGARANITNVASATAGADGRYTFRESATREGVQTGARNVPIDYSIAVSGPSGSPARQGFWASTVVAPGVAPAATVVAPQALLVRQCSAQVSGRVVDSVTDAPVAAATVRVSPPTNVDAVSVTTDAEGRYTVPAVMFNTNNVSGPLDVNVSKAGFTARKVTTASATCGASLTSDVQLVRNQVPGLLRATVTGRAVDQDTGQPLAGVGITTSTCSLPEPDECTPVVTGADGRYTLTQVPFQLPATPPSPTTTTTLVPPTVSVSIQGSLAGFWTGTVNVSLQSGATVPAPDLQMLQRKPSRVRGTVTELPPTPSVTEPIGPLAGATAGVTEARCEGSATAGAQCTTPTDGTYSIVDVPPGNRNATVSRTVVLSKAGYWTRSVGFQARAGEQATVDAALRKQCTATVRGVVRNARTQEPIVGATVSVPNGSVTPTTAPRSVTTDESGRFRIDNLLLAAENAPKSLSVSAVATGFYSNSTTVSLTTCGSVIELNFGELPTVTSVTPSTGPATGGTEVTITGSNLDSAVSVRFGDVTVPAVKVPGTVDQPEASVRATTPPGVPGSQVDVIVRNEAGDSVPSPAARFAYEQTTTTSTTTSTTSTTSTTTSTTSTTTSTTSTTTSTTSTTTTVPPTSSTSTTTSTTTTVPPTSSTSTTTSTTTTVPPTSSTSTTTTTTVPPPPTAPFVFAVTPSSGPVAGGGEVTVQGTNLAGALEVRFGSVASPSVVPVSDSTLRARVPAGAAGTVSVVVRNAAGTSAPRPGVTYTYTDPSCQVPPTLTRVSGRVVLSSGGSLDVNLERRRGLFDSVQYWNGRVSGSLRNPRTGVVERFSTNVLTSDNVATLLPGSCGGVRLRVDVLVTSTLLPSPGILRAELRPSGVAGTTATVSVGRASVTDVPATGRLSLG